MKKRREKFLQAKKSSPTFVGFFVYRLFSLHSTDRIRMSERKHIEKFDERLNR